MYRTNLEKRYKDLEDELYNLKENEGNDKNPSESERQKKLDEKKEEESNE